MFEAIVVVLIIYMVNMWSSVGKVEALNNRLDAKQRERLNKLAPTSMAKYFFYQKYKADIDKQRIPYVLLEDDEAEIESRYDYKPDDVNKTFDIDEDDKYEVLESSYNFEPYNENDGWHSLRECVDLKHEERCETYDITTRDQESSAISVDSSFDDPDRLETEETFECEDLEDDDDSGCFTDAKDVVCGVIWSEILKGPRCLRGDPARGPRR